MATGGQASQLRPPGWQRRTDRHLTTVEPANGFADAVFHYYLAEGCTPTAERNLDYNESIEVSTTTVAELVEAVASDDLRDGRTALAVLYYETFGN